MKKLKKFLFAAFTVAILSCLLCQPAFAAISESDVQAQVDAVGKEAVSGNVFIWFLCAIGFLKVGQKIDSFLSSLGVNVGHTGGSMLAEAMIAARGIGGIKNFSSHHFGDGRNNSSTNVNTNGGKGSGGFGAGFASGGLAGVVSRKVTNSAIKTATTTPGSKPSGLGSLLGDAAAGGIGGHMYASSVSKGGNFANNVIGSVATGSISQMGSISGEKAAEALHSYMGYAALESGAENVPTFQNVEIGGGRITGTEVTAEHPEGISFGMYHADQYVAPEGQYTTVHAVDGTAWYNEQCLLMQEDYLQFVQQIGSREAITRRFFLIFEYEPWSNTKRSDEEGEAINALQSAVHTATNYLRQCGNEVIVPENWDEFTVDVLYNLICRNESAVKPLSVRAQEVVAEYLAKGRDSEIDHIPATEFCAPKSIDFTHGHHICIDGLYYAYLLVPSDGYKTQVPAGWLSLIVNAGDGIDMDMFLSRQPKETIIQKVGQQLRINRSKIKDASDTNTDFDDIDGAIRSGYFLKEGLANNEDFYYLNLLITITASNEEDLEWKVSEMKKLLLSQDMNACTCHFREEQAFLSALPLVAMEKKLYERGKRNLLTGGAASCYPFTSYEMCDDNGILLGVNKYNSSLIIVDIFNSAVYKNANMSILGTSGAGKTFTMQLMALRMRRKNIPIFIVAPLKGHEFHRACSNVGGSFIQISPASPHCINVMEIRRVDRSVNEILDGPGIQLSELAAKIQQLHIFFSLLIPDMSHEERQLLDEALVRTYNTKGITHDNASLEDPAQPGQYREMPVLGDLYEILKTSKETMRMAHILNRLVNGSASTFNKQTNVRLDNKYTVLDISSLTGDLLTVGMFVALDFVWDRAKADRTEEKAIFIDECWQLLSGAGAAGVRLAGDFLLEIAKTIRGYGGASIFASQDLADFFDLDGGRFGKGIINNSKTKIILNLEDDEAQRVQEALHLSDAETMEITHFERGHGLISTNNNNIMVEFKASPLEKDLITTDRRELREIVERKRREQSTSAEQQI